MALCLAVVLGAACSRGKRERGPVVRVEPVAAGALRVGDTTSTTLWITVAEDHHVQANPAAQDNLRPLKVSFADSDRLAVTPSYPPPHNFKLEGAGWDLLVYDGKFAVTLSLAVPAGAAPGPIELDGTVAYQACKQNACLPPTSVPVRLTAVLAAP